MTDSIEILQDSIRELQAEAEILQDSIQALNFSDQIFHYGRDFHLDTWDWIACGIAFLSLIVAVGMAWWQWQTERNTMKITKEGQIGLLIDYVRHFYANLVVTVAIKEKLKGKLSCLYPSQEHFRKLSIDLEALHPDAFYRSKEKYRYVHNILVLSRNYNTEIEVAEMHICDKDMWLPAKERDFATLLFKPELLCKSFVECISKIAGRHWWIGPKKEYQSVIRDSIIDAAIRRSDFPEELKDNDEIKNNPYKKEQLRQRRIAYLRKLGASVPRYYYKNDSDFVAYLFKDDPELFFSLINANIHTEIIGVNKQNSPKLFLIPFDGTTPIEDDCTDNIDVVS